jgi:hypothetical protein
MCGNYGGNKFTKRHKPQTTLTDSLQPFQSKTQIISCPLRIPVSRDVHFQLVTTRHDSLLKRSDYVWGPFKRYGICEYLARRHSLHSRTRLSDRHCALSEVLQETSQGSNFNLARPVLNGKSKVSSLTN